MKSICLFAVIGLTAATFVERRATCNADNCLRALQGTGSNSGTTRPVIAIADCSSYFSAVTSTINKSTVTITPSVSVTTVTGTSTVLTTVISTEVNTATTTTSTITLPMMKRTASGIPSYASACSGSIRYSSACSCLGVTASTLVMTLATPTVTLSVAGDISTTTAISLTTAVNTVTTISLVTETDTTIATVTPICTVGSQIISNPSFELYEDSGTYLPLGWSVSSNPPYALINDGDCAEDGARCEYLVTPASSLTASIEQTLTAACLDRAYEFILYVGYYKPTFELSFGTYISVTLGDQTIVPRQLTCSEATPCNLMPNIENRVFYREITVPVVVSTVNPVLLISFDTIGGIGDVYDTVLDNVKMEL